MIEVINRELLIPREEYNIGTCYDNNTETRQFHLKRVTSGGVDLAALTFNLDIQYANGSTDAASLVKEVTDKDINLALTINNSMLQVPGTVIVQIRALEEDGTCKWTSYKSAFFVEDHINTPGHYEGDLTQLEQYEAEWGKVRDNVNQLNSRMDEVVKIHDDTPATEVEEEVIDGRVGYDGTQYDSFGTAVRQQIIDVREDMEENTADWTEALAAETAARTAADTTLQGNINSEALARATNDASLQSQIDQIIAPSGEAPSAAEVQNARIGADGITYDTLGDAIRNQLGDLKSALSSSVMDMDGYYLMISHFAKGAYTSSGPNTNPARAYMIVPNVNKKSVIKFDNTKVYVNYYYITSISDYTLVYSPNEWDSTGELTLDYSDNGTVFIVAKDATDPNARISDNLNLVNQSIRIYRKTQDGIISKQVSDLKDDVNENIYDISDIDEADWSKGKYSISGVVTDPKRIYMILENVVSGTCIEFDSEKILINYYYIKSTSDFTNLYSPDVWDSTGKINLIYENVGTVFVVARDAQDDDARVGDNPSNFNKYAKVYHKKTPTLNWLAFGDSITAGSYSNDEGVTLFGAEHSYAYRIANAIRRKDIASFFNCGVRGIGWINTGNNGETFDDMLSLYTGRKKAINLITILLGINDYASNETLGTTSATEKDGTISGNIRYGLRYLSENYSNAKIVVISPLNSTIHGNINNGWSRNVALNNSGTLQAVADMIKYWCDYFDITYINELSEGFINRYNIQKYMPDNLHPTDKGHWMLAQDIASKIF